MIELVDPYEGDKENEDVINRIWNVMSLIRKDGGFADLMIHSKRN